MLIRKMSQLKQKTSLPQGLNCASLGFGVRFVHNLESNSEKSSVSNVSLEVFPGQYFTLKTEVLCQCRSKFCQPRLNFKAAHSWSVSSVCHNTSRCSAWALSVHTRVQLPDTSHAEPEHASSTQLSTRSTRGPPRFRLHTGLMPNTRGQPRACTRACSASIRTCMLRIRSHAPRLLCVAHAAAGTRQRSAGSASAAASTLTESARRSERVSA